MIEGGGMSFATTPADRGKPSRPGGISPLTFRLPEDHSLWSVGWQRDVAESGHPDKQYMTVRKYLPDGKEAGAYLPRLLFPPGLEPAVKSWQNSGSITVAHDRVGLWVYSGEVGTKTEWVELDLNGNLLGRWRLDQLAGNTRVALTTDGHVFVQNLGAKDKMHEFNTLNRESSTWQPVESPPSSWLEGADGGFRGKVNAIPG